MDHILECTKCSLQTRKYSLFRCPTCNSVLEVKYDYSRISLPRGFRNLRPMREKYLPLLPVDSFSVKLKDGGTPLVKKKIDGIEQSVWLKMETTNPTHSFKDRGSSVEISRAVELGIREVCCGSTGNMGISIARYAKEAGIKSTVFISKDASARKIGLIRKSGGSVVKVNRGFNDAVDSAEAFSRKTGALVCGDYHYRKEGQKTMIFEIIDQFGYDVPDFVFLPVGNSTLLAGMHKGLVEYKKFSLIDRFPKIVAVQSEMCDPLVRAYNSRKNIEYMAPKTMADAIAVGYPTFGFEGEIALDQTNGLAVSVSEDEIRDAVNMLGRAGIRSEPGGAAGFAGFAKLYRSNRELFAKKKVVVAITGNNPPGKGL